MKLIITIPAYNEEDSIGELIKNIKKTFNATEYTYEIQVLNDGSTDGTADIVRSSGVKLYSHPVNYGLAETFREEMENALENGADIIVHIDADGQYSSDEILRLVDPIVKGEADLVLGSRFSGSIEDMPLTKKIGNRAFSRVVSNIIGLKITDAQTGFRAFRKEIAEKVHVRSGFTYTQEQIIKAAQKKFRIKEVPIHFAKRSSGSSRLMSNPIDYAIRGGINLLRIYRDFAPLRFFGFIGLILILIAFLLFLFSSLILKQAFDISVIIFTISGVQVILFGFLADMRREW